MVPHKKVHALRRNHNYGTNCISLREVHFPLRNCQNYWIYFHVLMSGDSWEVVIFITLTVLDHHHQHHDLEDEWPLKLDLLRHHPLVSPDKGFRCEFHAL